MVGGGGKHQRGVLGVYRGPPLFIAILLITAFNSQANALVCSELFTPAPSAIVSDQVVYNYDVRELEEVGSILLRLWWLDGAFGTPQEDDGTETDLGREYLDVSLDPLAMNVTVRKQLEGLPDYPDKQDSLRLAYKFPVSDGGDVTVCTVRMVFNLVDQNTEAPTVNQASYTASVREDFPTQYTIPDLQVLASDRDGAAPNNVLVVSFSEGCPLAASSPSYSAGAADVPITFVLTERLDYDTMADPPTVTCSVNVSDQGEDPGPLKATLTIEITVGAVNDETPKFEHPLYSSQMEGLEVPDAPLPVLPAPGLHATDADMPPQTLTYSMTVFSEEDPAWNDYFAVDATSGAVTVTQALDPDLLGEDYSVHFIVTVEDDSGATDTTVLEIILPTAPTTSTTSTTTTTTTPTTTTSTTTTTETPTTTTSTTTEPPTTTTSTTAEPPTTTTCTPCETITSTESTWTTPLSTTTTTATEPVTTSTTTTTTTNSPVTTEPTTCEPCTTEVVTCPTIESTTSTTTEGGSQTSTLEITPTSLSPTDNPVSSSESSSSLSTQSTDSLESSPTPNPTSPETGGPSTSEVVTCPTTETCEPCECSTTPTGSTDSTTTTVDPSAPTTTVDPSAPTTTTATPPTTITTTTIDTTTSEEPSGPQYRFEFQAYHFQPYTTTAVVGRIKVVQMDGSAVPSGAIVTYNWDSESAPGSDKFTLDQTTGEISMNSAAQSIIYKLVAQAIIDAGERLPVDVTIRVVEPLKCEDTYYIAQSVITKEVRETESDVIVANITTEVGLADQYCITDVQPEKYTDYFSIDSQGQLTLKETIDADPDGGRVVTVRVEVQTSDRLCKESSSGDLLRNEVLVDVIVKDENDQTPSFVMPTNSPTRVGYPTNRGLQQVAGPVITLKAEDTDTDGTLEFTTSGDNSDMFVVETDETTGSGALYLLDYEACGDQCEVTVSVTDGLNSPDGHTIQVKSLDLSQIYDIPLDGMDSKEIEDKVNELSTSTGLDLHLLYFSLSEPTSARGVRRTPRTASGKTVDNTNRDPSSFKIQGQDSEDGGARTWISGGPRGRLIQRRDLGFAELLGKDDDSEEDDAAGSWTSLAHVYGFQADGSLVTLDVLNSALANEDLKAEEFSEKAVFDPEVDDVSLSGWKAAVGVLGALVGLMLVAAIIGFVWYRKSERKPSTAKPASPLAVSTIGSAYPNHGFEDTEMNRLDSTSTSSNDSINKNSVFKKDLGSSNITGDTNNNNNSLDKADSGQTTTVEIMANPFTSAPVSPTYEDPSDAIPPPTQREIPLSRPRDPLPYAAPVERRSPPLYESTGSEKDLEDELPPSQQGGLRRITPAPLPDGAKSSPYLSKSEGDYEAFRPSDTERVASFTPYKGGEGKGSESPTLSSKPASPLLSASYKPVYKPEAAFSYLDDVPRREVKDTADKKDKSDLPKKQTKLDTSPYAFPVRTKKEPPNPALAAPAKPIMKNKKDSTLVSTNAEVHRSADDLTPSGGSFTGLKGSPPPKPKDDERERKSSLKYYTSEGETSDSELKKSVAFKVLVDEKHIKRRKEEKDKEEEEAKKKEKEDKDEEEEEETEDL